MSISKKERMKLLIEQIDLPQDIVTNYFQDSEIEKLELFKEEKLWIFHLNIKNVLPLDVYQVLLGHLKESFKGIANVNIKLRSEERRVGKECRSRWLKGEYKKKNKGI